MNPVIAASNRKTLSFLFVLILTVVLLASPEETQGADASNVRLVGYSDLQGRAALQVTLKGNYAYAGHHKGRARNPMTGKIESNGTTILDIANPASPKIITHIPGREGSESRAVQVVERYFDGKDYLLRNQEADEFTGFEIWDITERRSPRLVSQISGLQEAHNFGGDVVILDISDKAHPKKIGHIDTIPGLTRAHTTWNLYMALTSAYSCARLASR